MRMGPMILLAGALALPASVALGNEKAFATSYDQLKVGGQETGTADGLRMQRLPTGGILVVAATNPNLPTEIAPRSDAAIVNQVHQLYATDLDVKNKKTAIRVASNGGVVTLSGPVKNSRTARTAIRLALNADGVKAVNSELDWKSKHH